MGGGFGGKESAGEPSTRLSSGTRRRSQHRPALQGLGSPRHQDMAFTGKPPRPSSSRYRAAFDRPRGAGRRFVVELFYSDGGWSTRTCPAPCWIGRSTTSTTPTTSRPPAGGHGPGLRAPTSASAARPSAASGGPRASWRSAKIAIKRAARAPGAPGTRSQVRRSQLLRCRPRARGWTPTGLRMASTSPPPTSGWPWARHPEAADCPASRNAGLEQITRPSTSGNRWLTAGHRPGQHAGEVRHLLHHWHLAQPGRCPGVGLRRRQRAAQPRRHRDGPGPAHQDAAGRGRRRPGRRRAEDVRIMRDQPPRRCPTPAATAASSRQPTSTAMAVLPGLRDHQAVGMAPVAARMLELNATSEADLEFSGGRVGGPPAKQTARSASPTSSQPVPGSTRSVAVGHRLLRAPPASSTTTPPASGTPFFYFAYGVAVIEVELRRPDRRTPATPPPGHPPRRG